MASVKIFTVGPVVFRINWMILACVLITAFTFFRLGMWQLDRAQTKLQAQAEFELQQQRNAVAIDNIPASDLQQRADDLRNLHVALNGEYLNDRTILVLAQFFDTQIGYEVVTPFRQLGSDTLVLVSRGWTSGILPPGAPPALRPVSGLQKLTAQLHLPDEGERTIASQIDASQWPLRVRSIEMDVLETIFQEPLFPFVLRLTEDQPGMLVRHWEETNVDVNANLSYAFQWFTFSVLVLLASLLAGSNIISLMRDPEAGKFR